MNVVTLADALDACKELPAELRFDLVYLDPPYGVGTTMAARLEPGQGRGAQHAKSGPAAYEDREGVFELLRRLGARSSQRFSAK